AQPCPPSTFTARTATRASRPPPSYLDRPEPARVVTSHSAFARNPWRIAAPCWSGTGGNPSGALPCANAVAGAQEQHEWLLTRPPVTLPSWMEKYRISCLEPCGLESGPRQCQDSCSLRPKRRPFEPVVSHIARRTTRKSAQGLLAA